MASRVHALIARVALGVGLAAALWAWWFARLWLRGYQPPAGTDAFDLAVGTWTWSKADSGCVKYRHVIRFTPDHTQMIITSATPYRRSDGTMDSVAVYDILSHTGGRIRGAIRGETRRTAAGTPVVWDLVLRSPDRYAWHRTDWAAWGFTAEVRRCRPSEAAQPR